MCVDSRVHHTFVSTLGSEGVPRRSEQVLIRRCLVVLVLLGAGFQASAQDAPETQAPQQPVRPWTHPDVIVEALKIRMDEAQRLEFRSAITDFLQGYGSDVRRILNGNNQANLPRKIATKRRNRAKQMDKTMAAVLTDEQYPQYEAYRDALLAKMDEEAAQRRR